jgi:hypothetical protein
LFRVFPEGADPETDKPVAAIQGRNEGGKAEVVWRYEYKHDPEKPLTEKPKYFFTASGHCHMAQSGSVEISQTIKVTVSLDTGLHAERFTYSVVCPDESSISDDLPADCKIEKEDLIPGDYRIVISLKEESA